MGKSRFGLKTKQGLLLAVVAASLLCGVIQPISEVTAWDFWPINDDDPEKEQGMADEWTGSYFFLAVVGITAFCIVLVVVISILQKMGNEWALKWQ